MGSCTLDRRLFDNLELPHHINLEAYLGKSIGFHFDVLEFVLGIYVDSETYMKGPGDRRVTDYICSANNLYVFREDTRHFKEPEIEDMERLLRFYLIDTTKPPQTA